MALGVRAAQLGNNKSTATYTLITMFCAAMFLGVKAVEYSHKWDMGIFVRSQFALNLGHHAAPEGTLAHSLGISTYLVYLSVVPLVLLVGFIVFSIVSMLMSKGIWSKFFAGMAFTVAGYFFGAVVGHFYMQLFPADPGGGHAANQTVLYALQDEAGHAEGEAHGNEASESHDESTHSEGGHKEADHSHDAAGGHGDESHAMDHGPDQAKLDRDIGIFFSIYYCMTGLHAIHIIAGIGFLAWIFARSLMGHWRSDYFGPVDYVGLYWHLVDLIWIYLFPLLYLID